eukprot:gene5301-7364_t
MPKSKKSKVVSLTKTNSKGKSLKIQLIETLRKAIDEYESIYVFTYDNMRTAKFKDIRAEWKDSKIFMGKNKISQIAFGRSVEEEYKDNLRMISESLEGNVGILFTNRKHKAVIKYFKNYRSEEFAKAGAIPNETVILQPGPLEFPVSMMDELRKLGLTVEVENSGISLRTEFTVANEGEPLTPDQARILQKLNKKLVDFKINMLSYWNDGNFSTL